MDDVVTINFPRHIQDTIFKYTQVEDGKARSDDESFGFIQRQSFWDCSCFIRLAERLSRLCSSTYASTETVVYITFSAFYSLSDVP